MMTCARRIADGRARDDSPFKLDGTNKDEYIHGLCTYCGSINPDTLMERLRKGDVELVPTDKSYKVYVKGAGFVHAKFYFQHFSREQRVEFIELLNAQKLKFGEPGYFYVMPFFAILPGR